MQDNAATAELIKKFYQLFVDLDQERAFARLVEVVQNEPSICRAILCLKNHSSINVEAIAQRNKKPVTPNLNYRNLQDIPHKNIAESFVNGQPICSDLLSSRLIGKTDTLAGTRSIYIYPIVEREQVLAVFYLESQAELDELAPALVLAAQLIMGILFGILGLFLADPLLAMIKVALERRAERNDSEDREARAAANEASGAVGDA